MAYAGIASFVLASPIIHFAHGNIGAGFASLGLRVGPPALGVAAAYLCPQNKSLQESLGCFYGAFMLAVGPEVFAVPLIDAEVFAHKRVRERPEVGLVPVVGRDHAGLALGGEF